MKEFPREDWTDSFYATDEAVLLEPVPSDAPEARGVGFHGKVMLMLILHYQI